MELTDQLRRTIGHVDQCRQAYADSLDRLEDDLNTSVPSEAAADKMLGPFLTILGVFGYALGVLYLAAYRGAVMPGLKLGFPYLETMSVLLSSGLALALLPAFPVLLQFSFVSSRARRSIFVALEDRQRLDHAIRDARSSQSTWRQRYEQMSLDQQLSPEAAAAIDRVFEDMADLVDDVEDMGTRLGSRLQCLIKVLPYPVRFLLSIERLLSRHPVATLTVLAALLLLPGLLIHASGAASGSKDWQVLTSLGLLSLVLSVLALAAAHGVLQLHRSPRTRAALANTGLVAVSIVGVLILFAAQSGHARGSYHSAHPDIALQYSVATLTDGRTVEGYVVPDPASADRLILLVAGTDDSATPVATPWSSVVVLERLRAPAE